MKKSFKVLSLAILFSTLVVGCSNTDDKSSASTPNSSIANPSSDNINSSSNINDSSETPVKTVTSIDIGNYPSSDPVESVDDVDLSYVTIIVNYSDGSQDEIPVTSDMILWGEVNNGQVTAYITYEGQTTSFYVYIEEEVTKTDLQYSFSFESGTIFKYDGTGEEPNIRVTVLSEEAVLGVDYDWFFTYDDENYVTHSIGQTIPTEEGTYSLSIKVEGSRKFYDLFDYRWFKITNKEVPTIQFSFESGTSFAYDGTGDAPDFSVTVPEGVTYKTYFEEDGTNIGTNIPTTPGTYSFICETEENDTYLSDRQWRWFRITNTQKDKPNIEFTITNGDTFAYDGTGEAPNIGVIVSEGVTYKTYFEEDGTNIGTNIPTTPGTYSFICETEENDTYLSDRQWRWFKITSPSLVNPVIIFGEVTSFVWDGLAHTPTFTVSEGATYTYHYEKADAFYSYDAPTEVGTYALVVTVTEENGFNASKKWVVFRIDEPETESLSLKNHLPR